MFKSTNVYVFHFSYHIVLNHHQPTYVAAQFFFFFFFSLSLFFFFPLPILSSSFFFIFFLHASKFKHPYIQTHLLLPHLQVTVFYACYEPLLLVSSFFHDLAVFVVNISVISLMGFGFFLWFLYSFFGPDFMVVLKQVGFWVLIQLGCFWWWVLLEGSERGKKLRRSMKRMLLLLGPQRRDL